MLACKPFVNILRRATHCRYSTIIMANRMFMQCYSIDVDSEVGLNYLLFIPDTEEYADEFYSETLVLSPSSILARYNRGHKLLEEKKKEAGLKSKDVKEEFCFQIRNSHSAEIKFMYYLLDELVTTETYRLDYPIDMTSVAVETCLQSYTNLLNRIKPGGACLVFDGLRYDLQNKASECSEIYHFIIRYGGKKIQVPILRSMFNGIKDVDTLYLSLQESTLKDIYVYSFQYTKREITEQFWGYLLHY